MTLSNTTTANTTDQWLHNFNQTSSRVNSLIPVSGLLNVNTFTANTLSVNGVIRLAGEIVSNTFASNSYMLSVFSNTAYSIANGALQLTVGAASNTYVNTLILDGNYFRKAIGGTMTANLEVANTANVYTLTANNFGFNNTDRTMPELSMVFNRGFVPSNVDWVRNSIATQTAPSGIVETVALNTARINYNANTGECMGLLVESNTQNMLLHSSDFTQSWWIGGTGTTITSNTGPSIDGANTADTLLMTSGSSKSINQTFTDLPANTEFTFSLYIKHKSGTISSDQQVSMHLWGDWGDGPTAVSNNIGYAVSSTFKRFDMTATTSATPTTCYVQVRGDPAATIELDLAGGQLEERSEASTLVPTSASRVVRDNEYGQFAYAHPNSTEGSLVVEMGPVVADTSSTIIELFDSGETSFMSLANRPSGFAFNVHVAGVRTWTAASDYPVSGSKAALVWKSSQNAFFSRGSQKSPTGGGGTAATDAFAGPANLLTAIIGVSPSTTSGQMTSAHYKKIAIYGKRLSDATARSMVT